MKATNSGRVREKSASRTAWAGTAFSIRSAGWWCEGVHPTTGGAALRAGVAKEDVDFDLDKCNTCCREGDSKYGPTDCLKP